jgi:hypothetical protein
MLSRFWAFLAYIFDRYIDMHNSDEDHEDLTTY